MGERSGGLLLHPTSLPGGHAIGDMGPEAYRFVDLLVSAGQRLWQVLPLNPPGAGNSPYASVSAFAGNTYLLSLDLLEQARLLAADELAPLAQGSNGRVDFPRMMRQKGALLRGAFRRFSRTASAEARLEIERFRTEHSWIEDYALFEALRAAHRGAPWQRWNEDLAHREPSALDRARRKLSASIDFQVVTQFWFRQQWAALRRYANERGVRIVGDIPIFVANGADVWAHQHLFWLGKDGNPTFVAGVPPDYFSRTGQRWGNPLYRWGALRKEGFSWWIDRLRATFDQVDVLRVDHFRGLVAYWEIPADRPTAEYGRWAPGPGMELFRAVHTALGDVPIIVEDLGVITPDVVALRNELGYPGMRVLQFAFGAGSDNPFLPHNFERNTVVYTGTHDNDTTCGWFRACTPAERAHMRRYLGADSHDAAWDMIRLALSSVADVAVVPVQDVLSLGSEGRMNFPGRARGNWGWRLRDGELTDLHLDRLAQLTQLYGRG